jgi:hypothetical protein
VSHEAGGTLVLNVILASRYNEIIPLESTNRLSFLEVFDGFVDCCFALLCSEIGLALPLKNLAFEIAGHLLKKRNEALRLGPELVLDIKCIQIDFVGLDFSEHGVFVIAQDLEVVAVQGESIDGADHRGGESADESESSHSDSDCL